MTSLSKGESSTMNKRVIAIPFLSVVVLMLVALTMQIAYASGVLTAGEAEVLRGGCKQICFESECGLSSLCSALTCIPGDDCGAALSPTNVSKCVGLWNDPKARCASESTPCGSQRSCSCEDWGSAHACLPTGSFNNQPGQSYVSCYTVP